MKRQSILDPWTIFVALILLLPLSSTVCQATEAPKFWLSNLEDVRFDSRKHQGSILISFFFIDCLPCRKEIPQLYRLVVSKKSNIALLFIDPEGGDSRESIRAFARRLGVPADYFYHDALGRLARKFVRGKMVFPTIIGIKNNRIQFTVHSLKKPSIRKIGKLLAE
ncbi:MAG: redoxin domain-containing protein [Proteobacteria bacterium]|nr:redoxin domain-containing protein [Pseudomonadota bacterium]